MLPFSVRTIQDGPRRLVLRERQGMVQLIAGNVILLSSSALETERAFGRLAAEWPGRTAVRAPRVLVGGLGFGATVRGVLDVVDAQSHVVVVEKVGAVERLVRGELSEIAGRPLSSERVRVVVGDVADAIAEAGAKGGAFHLLDAILIDVDNGPHWVSARENSRLYTRAGVAAAARALAPGGLFAVWSGYPADGFMATLRSAGLIPGRVLLRERGRVRARAYGGVKPATGHRERRDD